MNNLKLKEKSTSLRIDIVNNLSKDVLRDLGISNSSNGFEYLIEAINYSKNFIESSYSLNRRICYVLGEKFRVTPISIESSMWRAIHLAWNCGDNSFAEVLGYHDASKPGITEFIKLIINKIEMADY